MDSQSATSDRKQAYAPLVETTIENTADIHTRTDSPPHYTPHFYSPPSESPPEYTPPGRGYRRSFISFDISHEERIRDVESSAIRFADHKLRHLYAPSAQELASQQPEEQQEEEPLIQSFPRISCRLSTRPARPLNEVIDRSTLSVPQRVIRHKMKYDVRKEFWYFSKMQGSRLPHTTVAIDRQLVNHVRRQKYPEFVFSNGGARLITYCAATIELYPCSREHWSSTLPFEEMNYSYVYGNLLKDIGCDRPDAIQRRINCDSLRNLTRIYHVVLLTTESNSTIKQEWVEYIKAEYGQRLYYRQLEGYPVHEFEWIEFSVERAQELWDKLLFATPNCTGRVFNVMISALHSCSQLVSLDHSLRAIEEFESHRPGDLALAFVRSLVGAVLPCTPKNLIEMHEYARLFWLFCLTRPQRELFRLMGDEQQHINHLVHPDHWHEMRTTAYDYASLKWKPSHHPQLSESAHRYLPESSRKLHTKRPRAEFEADSTAFEYRRLNGNDVQAGWTSAAEAYTRLVGLPTLGLSVSSILQDELCYLPKEREKSVPTPIEFQVETYNDFILPRDFDLRYPPLNDPLPSPVQKPLAIPSKRLWDIGPNLRVLSDTCLPW
ncbi:uncharacterized protein V2V93DRAFT_362052 [Kockiozyma suomiensis]|uniref:uncharacterized protein n=1 Tax=Kockiozyma suomiensis TaxID=1337062 RepID=UPI0033431664